MKIIAKLKPASKEAVTEADWQETHGIVATVHDEPRAGVIRKLQLGHTGLTFQRGEFKVGIPRAALIELLESIEPGLKCPPPPKLTADQIPPAQLKQFTQS